MGDYATVHFGAIDSLRLSIYDNYLTIAVVDRLILVDVVPTCSSIRVSSGCLTCVADKNLLVVGSGINLNYYKKSENHSI